MTDPQHSPGYTPPTGVVNGVVKTADMVVAAISSPLLIFVVVIAALMMGTIVYVWTQQRAEAIAAYAHLVDACLPNREKD